MKTVLTRMELASQYYLDQGYKVFAKIEGLATFDCEHCVGDFISERVDLKTTSVVIVVGDPNWILTKEERHPLYTILREDGRRQHFTLDQITYDTTDVTGFKGFNYDMTCRDKHYECNKKFTEESAQLCMKGIHFYESPLDIFEYYVPTIYHNAIQKWVRNNFAYVISRKTLRSISVYDSKKTSCNIEIGNTFLPQYMMDERKEYIKERDTKSKPLSVSVDNVISYDGEDITEEDDITSTIFDMVQISNKKKTMVDLAETPNCKRAIAITKREGYSEVRNGIAISEAKGTSVCSDNSIAIAGNNGVTYAGRKGIAITGEAGTAVVGSEGIAIGDEYSLVESQGRESIAITKGGIAHVHEEGVSVAKYRGKAECGSFGIAVGSGPLAVAEAKGFRTTAVTDGEQDATAIGEHSIALGRRGAVVGENGTGIVVGVYMPPIGPRNTDRDIHASGGLNSTLIFVIKYGFVNNDNQCANKRYVVSFVIDGEKYLPNTYYTVEYDEADDKFYPVPCFGLVEVPVD